MKRFSIKYSILATLIVAVSALTSCRNEFDFERAYDGEKFAEKKVLFEESFKTTFCDGVEICPTHTWGFGELKPIAGDPVDGASTRAGSGITETKRVMCEDLGMIGDFDYNDVVFDVYYEGNTAHINLLAAGATLDIYIGKIDPKYEVHNLFGVAKGVMVNTARAGMEGNVNSGVVAKDPVSFEIAVSSTDPNDIPIYVGDSNSNYALAAAQGEAPHKICVANTVRWTNERLNISVQYPDFPKWVSNPNISFSEKEDVIDDSQVAGAGVVLWSGSAQMTYSWVDFKLSALNSNENYNNRKLVINYDSEVSENIQVVCGRYYEGIFNTTTVVGKNALTVNLNHNYVEYLRYGLLKIQSNPKVKIKSICIQ